jgi:hypothetical protein
MEFGINWIPPGYQRTNDVSQARRCLILDGEHLGYHLGEVTMLYVADGRLVEAAASEEL